MSETANRTAEVIAVVVAPQVCHTGIVSRKRCRIISELVPVVFSPIRAPELHRKQFQAGGSIIGIFQTYVAAITGDAHKLAVAAVAHEVGELERAGRQDSLEVGDIQVEVRLHDPVPEFRGVTGHKLEVITGKAAAYTFEVGREKKSVVQVLSDIRRSGGRVVLSGNRRAGADAVGFPVVDVTHHDRHAVLLVG